MKPDVFLEPLRRGTTLDAEGKEVSLSSAIFEDHAKALYKVVKDHRPELAIEIGMAHGISTLAILSALDETGRGRLTSIDPNQDTDWRGEGRLAVERAGLAHYHDVIAMSDFIVLPQLVEKGVEIQFAYVDGWHTFDFVVLDLFYLDKLLSVGGIIGFNDCGFPAVRRALRFLTTHRHYQQIDVGLPRNYAASTRLKSVTRRVLRASHEDRYFKKVDDWTPPWNYYRHF